MSIFQKSEELTEKLKLSNEMRCHFYYMNILLIIIIVNNNIMNIAVSNFLMTLMLAVCSL